MCGSKEKISKKTLPVLMAFEEDHARLHCCWMLCWGGSKEEILSPQLLSLSESLP